MLAIETRLYYVLCSTSISRNKDIETKRRIREKMTDTATATATEELDVSAVADAIASAVSVPPPPLETGWILKESRSQPGCYYYYNLETGICSWRPPYAINLDEEKNDGTNLVPSKAVDGSPSKTSHSEKTDDKSSKRRKTNSGAAASAATMTPAGDSGTPTQVRVLHILKKHKGSRRPSSWRQPIITQTLDEAKEELQGLLEILQEESSPEELQATFEELARTESDCSSAKRGGDLGFFGRRKMQPAFEEASFGLKIGELTKEIVETSSGAHILLRIG